MSIEVKNIKYCYGRIRALDGVDLSLPGGGVGLLGPNGAGKSTLIRILLGFLVPDEGEGSIFGLDIRTRQTDIRRLIGYMPEDDCLIPGMDAVNFTSYLGELSGMPRQEAMKRAHEVLYYVGLEESRYRLLQTYSSGMKQRLKLAQALVHDPRLLFLDEPTSGLDPQGRKEILELILDISSEKNIQVLISSHILTDIELTCSHVVILDKGRVAAKGEIEALRQMDYSLYELRIKGEKEAFLQDLRGFNYKIEELEEGLIRIFMPPDRSSRDILEAATERDVQIRHFVRSRSSLDDLFAKVVGAK
ncbi:MAG: ABC transporter ATP-binding protein [Candidatus Aminicenantes bacterium]|nr:ABC transporter ATP-binding protein [Candidatus Aminicenantes bacterium]